MFMAYRPPEGTEWITGKTTVRGKPITAPGFKVPTKEVVTITPIEKVVVEEGVEKKVKGPFYEETKVVVGPEMKEAKPEVRKTAIEILKGGGIPSEVTPRTVTYFPKGALERSYEVTVGEKKYPVGSKAYAELLMKRVEEKPKVFGIRPETVVPDREHEQRMREQARLQQFVSKTMYGPDFRSQFVTHFTTKLTPIDPFGLRTLYSGMESVLKKETPRQRFERQEKITKEALEWIGRAGRVETGIPEPRRFVGKLTLESPVSQAGLLFGAGQAITAIGPKVAGVIAPRLAPVIHPGTLAAATAKTIGPHLGKVFTTGVAVTGGVIEGAKVSSMITQKYEPSHIAAEISKDIALTTAFISGTKITGIRKKYVETRYFEKLGRQELLGRGIKPEVFGKKERVELGKRVVESAREYIIFERPKLYKEAKMELIRKPWLMREGPAKIISDESKAIVWGEPGKEMGMGEFKAKIFVGKRVPVFVERPGLPFGPYGLDVELRTGVPLIYRTKAITHFMKDDKILRGFYTGELKSVTKYMRPTKAKVGGVFVSEELGKLKIGKEQIALSRDISRSFAELKMKHPSYVKTGMFDIGGITYSKVVAIDTRPKIISIGKEIFPVTEGKRVVSLGRGLEADWRLLGGYEKLGGTWVYRYKPSDIFGTELGLKKTFVGPISGVKTTMKGFAEKVVEKEMSDFVKSIKPPPPKPSKVPTGAIIKSIKTPSVTAPIVTPAPPKREEKIIPELRVKYPHEVEGIYSKAYGTKKQLRLKRKLLEKEWKRKARVYSPVTGVITGRAKIVGRGAKSIFGELPKQRQVPLQMPAQKQMQKQLQKQMTQQITITPTVTPVVTPFDMPTPTPFIDEPPMPPLPPFIPILDFKLPRVRGRKARMGYKTEIFRKGKWMQVSRKPLRRREAIKLGARKVDVESLAARFRIRPIGTAMFDIGKVMPYPMPRLATRFRGYKIRKGRRIPLMDEWIERKTFRLERRGFSLEVPEIMEAKLMKSMGLSKITTDIFGGRKRKRNKRRRRRKR